ncbi:MAG TPA: hypothetical protein PLT05_01865 [bacterium]|nr:hypothetical protein [bacterium]HQH80156.1 hypothetical protein [bacterium]
MRKTFLFVAVLFAIPFVAEAKSRQNIEAAVASNFPPAVHNKSLDTAHYELNKGALRGFVVVKRGGIPADRARFFIEWQEYDYRGSVIHMKDGRIVGRRGKPYTYLQPGDVMAVAGIKYFNNAVYLKLISVDVYFPLLVDNEKRHSRVTCMPGFKFDSAVFKSDDAKAVIDGIKEWLEPFDNENSAKEYGAKVKAEMATELALDEDMATTEEKEKADASKESFSDDTIKLKKASIIDPERPPATEQDKLEALEEKIEAAKRQMEEAESEMRRLKIESEKKK